MILLSLLSSLNVFLVAIAISPSAAARLHNQNGNLSNLCAPSLLMITSLDKTWSQSKTIHSKAALAMQCQPHQRSKRADGNAAAADAENSSVTCFKWQGLAYWLPWTLCCKQMSVPQPCSCLSCLTSSPWHGQLLQRCCPAV